MVGGVKRKRAEMNGGFSGIEFEMGMVVAANGMKEVDGDRVEAVGQGQGSR